MKASYIYSILCLILVATSCTSKEESGKKNEEMEIPVAKAKVSEEPAELKDPDPTDDIPAADYLAESTSQETAEIVIAALQKQFKEDIDKGLLEESARKFVQYEYDLNGDGSNEIMVGLVGPYFCGSGGCTQYILDKNGNVITVFSVADYPVIIGSNKTNDWNDLIIFSGGKNRLVKFDGKKYPSNPSVQPALDTNLEDGLTKALDFTNDKYPWFQF